MSLIVPHVLNNNNYKIWSACMKDYLSSQDLWDNIIVDINDNNNSSSEWKKKNGMALHAIKMSCAPKVLSQIGFAERASDAWKQLERIQKKREKGTSESLEICIGIESRSQGNDDEEVVVENIKQGKLTEVRRLIMSREVLKKRVTSTGGTLLHAAIAAEKVEIVKLLVDRIGEEEDLLKIEDENLFTALDTVAAHTGDSERALAMAHCIAARHPQLVTHGEVLTPILIASAHGHKEMTRYLYKAIVEAENNIVDALSPANGGRGTILLSQCINGKMFDVASLLLGKFPELATKQCAFIDPIKDLCKLPSSFSTETLSWKDSIISCLCGASGRLLRVIKFLRIVHKTYEDQKVIHSQAREFLKSMCNEISKLNEDRVKETWVREAMLEAARNGIAEFIIEMIRANKKLMLFFDGDRRNIFSYAVIHRREKVFNLIYAVSPKVTDLTNIADSYDNNMLHLAATMPDPSSTYHRTSGAALQMQRELQWFKEVERLCKPSCKEMLNQDGLSPRQLFTMSHKELVKEGENWMKTTAQSSTVVVALIVTVTFAAAISVPGGTDQVTGLPIFLPHASLTIFTVLNALSFFSSLTSVLMFLGILTSRYAEEDFLVSLPTKLIIGLTSLTVSIATMMATFCCALVIILNGRLLTILPVGLLSCIPILFFFFSSLYPLLHEVFVSTYGPSIFDTTTKFPTATKSIQQIKTDNVPSPRILS